MQNHTAFIRDFKISTISTGLIFTRRPEDDYPEISARTPSVLESDGEYNRAMSQETRQPSALNVNR